MNKMKPLNVDIMYVEYHRPGKSKIGFLAFYEGYLRRGAVLYDTVKQHFLSHTRDIQLLAAVCEGLQKPKHNKVR